MHLPLFFTLLIFILFLKQKIPFFKRGGQFYVGDLRIKPRRDVTPGQVTYIQRQFRPSNRKDF